MYSSNDQYSAAHCRKAMMAARQVQTEPRAIATALPVQRPLFSPISSLLPLIINSLLLLISLVSLLLIITLVLILLGL